MDIKERVNELIANYLEQNAIELIDIIYRREQGGMVLRLLVDKPEGINISECEEVNNYLSATLDKEGIITDRYTLEVSSPGLDRPLKTDKDFERKMGRKLEVNTYEAVDEKKTHEGTLLGIDKDNIIIEKDGISTVIPRAKIALARQKIEF